MRYLKTYNEAIERGYAFHTTDKLSIYDFFESLKTYNWYTSKYNQKHSVEYLSKWTDHFVGPGWWNKISSHVDNIFNKCKEVDLKHINDAMLEVFDSIPDQKERSIFTSVLYGDYSRIDDDVKYKYNGLMPIQDLNSQDRKNQIISSILISMLMPTLKVGHFSGDTFLRETEESEFVTDSKYQCQNFSFDEFLKSSVIAQYEYDNLKKYSPDNVLSMYRPGVVIMIGGHDNNIRTGKMDLLDIESKLDDVIDVITSEIDYEEIIWGYSRGDRYFKDTEIYEYELKILLDM